MLHDSKQIVKKYKRSPIETIPKNTLVNVTAILNAIKIYAVNTNLGNLSISTVCSYALLVKRILNTLYTSLRFIILFYSYIH